jgi:hypothetical protein
VNELATQGTNASPKRLGFASWVFQDSGISELVVAVMSQSSIANTKLVELAKVGCFVANLVQPLNAEWRYQFALLEGLKGIGAVDLFGEMTRIGCLQPSHDIDLIQRELNAYVLVRKASITSKSKRLT